LDLIISYKNSFEFFFFCLFNSFPHMATLQLFQEVLSTWTCKLFFIFFIFLLMKWTFQNWITDDSCTSSAVVQYKEKFKKFQKRKKHVRQLDNPFRNSCTGVSWSRMIPIDQVCSQNTPSIDLTQLLQFLILFRQIDLSKFWSFKKSCLSL
jgi:hypothetical protein